MLSSERGFTFVELIVGMVIMSMLIGVVGSTLYYFLIIPTWQSDRLEAVNDLRFALDIIQRDGVQAQSFTLADAAPDYGYFTWNYFDSATGDVTEQTFSYSYDPDQGRLLREDSKEGSTTAIASYIASFDDVTFVSSEDGNAVTVTITVTVESARTEATTETGSRDIEMRLTP